MGRPRPIMLKILPIMLLNNALNQAYYTQYYAFNIMIMLSKMLLDCRICYFTDCSIRVSQFGCCNACLTSKESMYSVTLHIFYCNNLKLDLVWQSHLQIHCAV